jgi:hypothetical protein
MIHLGLGALTALACSPPAPPIQPAPPPTASTAAAPPPAEPDLSPVAAPRTVVAVGRWSSVAGTLKTLDAAGKIPLGLDSLLEKELGDRELLALLKLDGAIDGAVMIDPASTPNDPAFPAVVSLPLRELNGALALAGRARKPTPIRPGVFRIGFNKDLVCDLSVSVGDAPARLLCGGRERDLDLLVPWMTRGLPRDSFGGADLHLELRVGGLRERYKEELAVMGPALPVAASKMLQERGITDPVLLDMGAAAAKDVPRFTSDLDALLLDVKLDQTRAEASVSGTIKFKGTSSWATRFMTHRNGTSGSPPPIFWQLPRESGSASFYHGADSRMFEELRGSLATAVRAVIPPKALAPADARAIVELIATAPVSNARGIVTARGHLPARAPEKPIRPEDFKPADAVRIALQRSSDVAGWGLVGLEAKADPYVTWLKQLGKLYSSRTLQTSIQKKLSEKTKEPRAAALPWLSVHFVKPPRGVPENSFVLEMRSVTSSRTVWKELGSMHGHREHPKTGEIKASTSSFIAVSQDGEHTWIASSADVQTLGRILNAVRTGAPRENTLGAQEGLDALKVGTNTGGGFVIPRSIADTFNLLFSDEVFTGGRQSIEEALAVIPNKGKTPVFLFASGEDGEAPSNTARLVLQRGSFEDLMTLVSRAIKRRADASATPAGGPAPGP